MTSDTDKTALPDALSAEAYKFDEKNFLSVKFEPRTKIVPVPELQEFFHPESPAQFVVRGLTAAELSRIVNADDRNKLLTIVLDKIAGSANERADAILEQLGITLDGKVPGDVAQQIECAAMSTEPSLSRPAWVRMARTHPVVLKRIYIVAFELTGMGQVVKKKPV